MGATRGGGASNEGPNGEAAQMGSIAPRPKLIQPIGRATGQV